MYTSIDMYMRRPFAAHATAWGGHAHNDGVLAAFRSGLNFLTKTNVYIYIYVCHDTLCHDARTYTPPRALKNVRVLGRGLNFLFFWRRFRGLNEFLSEFLKPLLSSQKLALGGCQNYVPFFKR